jgi:hypothetical protein
MKHKLVDLNLPEEIALQSEAYIAILHRMGDTLERRVITSAYVDGFRGVFGFFCALSGVALIISFLVKHYNIDRAVSSEHTTDKAGEIEV